MKRNVGIVIFALAALAGCSRTDTSESAKTAPTTPPATAPAQGAPAAAGPHAFVHLKDGSKVPGAVVASSQTEIVLAGDDGIERKIPLDRVQSVEYANAAPVNPEPTAPPRDTAPAPKTAPKELVSREPAPRQAPVPPPPPPPVTTKTFVLPAGSEVSVRTNEAIDSA